jgi:hypothetical protein
MSGETMLGYQETFLVSGSGETGRDSTSISQEVISITCQSFKVTTSCFCVFVTAVELCCSLRQEFAGEQLGGCLRSAVAICEDCMSGRDLKRDTERGSTGLMGVIVTRIRTQQLGFGLLDAVVGYDSASSRRSGCRQVPKL